ncbi:glycosyltransferase family 39 protein [Streptomyces yaanensis]|uniref:Glycosyltransferase family 39 protein n=1 Tax=Streptomyces yaanensis TaxID=1142239 RepID=A0ABV7S6U6_9ACTN|nr:glycosyltransferase family 39 protein [Streptomyces sp. CGMCC 4.7035]WNC00083.1 glycosyltransferase family 39 protein [Streptomyces sp. CGMCC 4.7035]
MALLSPPAQKTGDAAVDEAQHDRRTGSVALWLWPSVVTLAVAMYRIGAPLLGRDELTSWDVAGRSIGQVVATMQRVDGVLGAYYLILHGWMTVFGDSDMALRMPSALAMAGTAACVALTGKRLFGRRAGLTGGLLFALIPAVSRFAHEARPYALVMLAVALTALLLLRALDQPDSWQRWGLYALGVAAVGLLHLIALTCLIGHLVLVVLRARHERRVLWGFCLMVFAGVAGVGPVVVLGRAQTGRQTSWIAEPGAWGLVDIWSQLFYSGLCAGAVILLAMVACGRRREAVLFCAASAMLPPLVIWALSHGEISYFYFRYMLFTLPAFAVLAGAGLDAGARSRRALVPALLVLGLLTLPDQNSLRQPLAHYWTGGPDYAAAARTIKRLYAPGDAIVYDRNEEAGMFALGVRRYLPRELKMRDVFLSESAAQRNDLLSTDCPKADKCVGREKRIWVVVMGKQLDPLDALPQDQAQALRAHYTETGADRPTGLTVGLLVRKP